MPKKIERGALVSSGFVVYVKKIKGGPFALISAVLTWPYGLSSFSSFFVRKVDQSE